MTEPHARNSPGKPLLPTHRRRLWLFRVAAMLLGPTAFFLGLEIALRLFGFGYDPNFFQRLDIGGKPFLVPNEAFSRRFFPPETMRHPNALRMAAEKPAGTIRIFVLGESAAMGDPEPAFGPARYLEVLLLQKFPAQQFEIVNVSFTAINSHVLLPIARECARHDGDLWIIYMGNNEMVGPYGAATILGAQAPPRTLVRLVTGLQRSRFGQLVMMIVRQLQTPANHSKSWGGMAMFQEQRVAPDSPKRQVVHEIFAANLQDLVRCGLNSGAGIILNTVAVNLHDSPPFASLVSPTLPLQQQTNFDRLLQQGRQAQAAKDWTNAAALFNEATKLSPGHAEAHYRLALGLEQTAQLKSARAHFQLACDTDALPFRTDSQENALIRATATRHAPDRLLLVDAAEILAKQTPTGLCGPETFYEHVHFNFDGGYRLGLAWARAVAQILPSQQSTNDWATQFQCEQQLGLTDFNRRLVIQSVRQRLQVAPLNAQFNNPERLERLATYESFLRAQATEAAVTEAHKIFAAALAARPEDFHLRETYAVFLQASGNATGAIEQWRKVGALLPQDFLPWFEIGSILSQQNNFTESETYLRKAIGLRADLVEGWSELGKCLGARSDWLPALAAFERASALRPHDPVLWAFRAKVLAGLHRTNETIACYRQAVALNPNYAEAHAALGDQYSQAGKIPEAIAAYESAIRAKPDYAIAYSNLGVMFTRQGRLDEALVKFRKALALDPGNAVTLDYLQQVQARRNQSR